MPDITIDAINIINDILESLARRFPECTTKISAYVKESTEGK